MTPMGSVKSRFRFRLPLHYALVLPATLIVAVTMLYPIAHSLWTSLHDFTLIRPTAYFVGLENYARVLTDPAFWNAMWITVVYVAGSVALQTLMGLAMALLMNRTIKGQGLLRTFLLMPVMLTPVVVGLMWVFMYNPELGIINYMLSRAGVPGKPVWLGNPSLAMISVIVADSWRNTPFLFLMLLAGLQSLPTDPTEAAIVDGATRWQLFRYVTMPLLKPVFLTAVAIRGMDAFREFDLIYILTGGGPSNATEVASIYAYNVGFRHFDIGEASAISYLILIAVLVFGVFFVRAMRNIRLES